MRPILFLDITNWFVDEHVFSVIINGIFSLKSLNRVWVTLNVFVFVYFVNIVFKQYSENEPLVFNYS